MPLACGICILTRGLTGADLPHLPKTREDLEMHMLTQHTPSEVIAYIATLAHLQMEPRDFSFEEMREQL